MTPNEQPFAEELHAALGALQRVLTHGQPGAPLPADVFQNVEHTAERLTTLLDSSNGSGLPRWLLTCEACGEECADFRSLKDHRRREHDLRATPPQIGDTRQKRIL